MKTLIENALNNNESLKQQWQSIWENDRSLSTWDEIVTKVAEDCEVNNGTIEDAQFIVEDMIHGFLK